MKALRDIAVLLVVTAGFTASLFLFGRQLGYGSPWFALLFMFCFLGWVRLARPLFILKMPTGLRAVREWELRGVLYRRLAVPGFGELLRGTPLRHLQPEVYLNRHPENPGLVTRELEGAEAAHFWAALLYLPFQVHEFLHHAWTALGWSLLVQIVGNLYPILHLRWIRGRLDRVLNRKRRP